VIGHFTDGKDSQEHGEATEKGDVPPAPRDHPRRRSKTNVSAREARAAAEDFFKKKGLNFADAERQRREAQEEMKAGARRLLESKSTELVVLPNAGDDVLWAGFETTVNGLQGEERIRLCDVPFPEGQDAALMSPGKAGDTKALKLLMMRWHPGIPSACPARPHPDLVLILTRPPTRRQVQPEIWGLTLRQGGPSHSGAGQRGVPNAAGSESTQREKFSRVNQRAPSPHASPPGHRASRN
jgi:hypothetical protein